MSNNSPSLVHVFNDPGTKLDRLEGKIWNREYPNRPFLNRLPEQPASKYGPSKSPNKQRQELGIGGTTGADWKVSFDVT
jgi:hypothetical protein